MIKYFKIPNQYLSSQKNSFIYKYIYICFSFLFFVAFIPSIQSQPCVSQSAPPAQVGAHVNNYMLTNMWYSTNVRDFNPSDESGVVISRVDGWPVAGRRHSFNPYPNFNNLGVRLKKDEIFKCIYKGTPDQLSDPGIWHGRIQNKQVYTALPGYTYFEIRVTQDSPDQFFFYIQGRVTDIQLMMPGFELFDQRMIRDELVAHLKHWKALRFMGINDAPGNTGQTWGKRVSANAPMQVNGSPNPYTGGFTYNENTDDNSRGTSWELQIDIANYLGKDMWINIPPLVDDNYVFELGKLLKERLKPSLNVYVEIGNEIWNFASPFNCFNMSKQKIWEEWKGNNPEYKKIFGGDFCPGCGIEAGNTANYNGPNDIDLNVWRRWPARRLKDYGDQFIKVFGDREAGGLGNRIRLVLAAHQYYAGNGDGLFIGPGLDYLEKAYGDPLTPYKYLYGIAGTLYYKPDNTTINSSVNEIVNGVDSRLNDIFAEYDGETATIPGYTGPIYLGNKLEGWLGKARTYGLKYMAYEGGNELSTGGEGGSWLNYTNSAAYFADPRSGMQAKRCLDTWFSWLGYDAMLIKNGDFVEENPGGYSIATKLNEQNPLRMAWVNAANQPAVPLNNTRGGTIGQIPISFVDARKYAAYMSIWNQRDHIQMESHVQNGIEVGNSANENPWIIRCQKTGIYKFSVEGGDFANTDPNKFVVDIYLNEKLILKNFDCKSTINNNGGFAWSKTISIEIPYGVHALRIRPRAPVAPLYATDLWADSRYLRIKIKQMRFELSTELPPAQPKPVLGEQVVCKNNSKASYEVSEVDASVCDYVWSGLPAGAKILDKEQVPNTNPVKYFSGQGTYKIFIDWTSAAPGSYTLSVKGRNETSAGVSQFGAERTFTVKVENCGFTYAPNPVCTNNSITYTPLPMSDVSKVEWNFGSGAIPSQFVVATALAPVEIKYTSIATRDVTLKVTDNAGKSKTYFGTVNVTSCNTPSVVIPVNLCKDSPGVVLTATPTNGASVLKWYDSNGTALATAPITLTSAVGTKTFSVSQMNDGQESEKVKIDVIISAAPATPTINGLNPLAYCKGATATVAELTGKVTPATGTTLKWYLGSSTTGLSTPTNTVTTSASELVWNVTQSIGSCESPKAPLTVKVNEGPQFTVNAMDPINCGDKGKIILKGLTAATVYQVGYNTLPATAQTADATGNITFDLPQGNYKDFKVNLAGCSTTVATAYTITDPLSPTFTVAARQPAACGALGAIVLKGLKNNTAYKISYNSIVDEARSSTGDSISIALPKNDYAGFKVNLNGCMKTDAGTYKLSDPVAVPLVEKTGNSNYCQNQVVNITDLTSRVQGKPNGQLKWYTAIDGVPTNQPQAPSTAVAGEKKVWVSQTIDNCESSQLELTIFITASTALTVSPKDPTACGATDGALEISGLANIREYNIEFKKEGQSQTVKTFTSNSSGKITLISLAAGSYSSITATPVLGSSCFTNSSETLTLTAPGAPTLPPSIAGAADYCAGSTIAALTATANSSGTIEWFSNPELTTSVATTATYQPTQVTGSATYYAVETVNGNCKSPQASATINIVANPTPQGVIGAGGTATCNGTGYELKLNSSEIGVTYTVYKNNLVTTIIQDGTGAAIPFPDQSEQGVYIIKAESKIKSCKADMTGALTINPKINPTVFTTAGGLTGCEGTVAANANITLSGSQDNTAYGLMPSMEVKTGKGSPIEFSKTATTASNGTYTIIATNTQTGCDTLMNGNAKIDIKKGVGEPTLAGDLFYCNKGSNEILVAVENATTKVWSISPANAGTVDNTGKVTWNNTYIGQTTIKVVVSNALCGTETKTDELSTTVTATPQVSPISGDSLVCRGNIVTYQILPQVGITYNWSINANTTVEKDDSKGTITVTYLEDLSKEGATISVTPSSLTCGDGQAQTKSINKDNGCDLFVPNILTPSTADKNSVWQLEGVENYPKLSIQIFNRWGAEVHSHNGKYDKPWDGTTNGNALPTATYYYVIDKKDGTSKITGSVTVVRE